MRQALFGPILGKVGLEVWRFKSNDGAVHHPQCWRIYHGWWLHKRFFRQGDWVYTVAWNWPTGKSHL